MMMCRDGEYVTEAAPGITIDSIIMNLHCHCLSFSYVPHSCQSVVIYCALRQLKFIICRAVRQFVIHSLRVCRTFVLYIDIILCFDK